ncbi:hypothetical protein KNP414_06713 [Paenibacillus mucilaginosus KNP414]|uniref:Uncharacterized protein n=1 Tax=Paenibacillus mucilaginosus (strain KNP414) TaxID=1036673 RepID=F8FCB3_PAEMK|nr:hypothetical protein KNP414_06713 [Paenibacillus mucilaginosus KNP414]
MPNVLSNGKRTHESRCLSSLTKGQADLIQNGRLTAVFHR